MKTTIVPAQITTVEDRVAGNLSFRQLMLLTTPIFIGGALYVFLPPFVSFSIYKVLLIILLSLICMSLAVRIKGRLVLEWVVVRAKFNNRPVIYVADKNDSYLRPNLSMLEEPEIIETKLGKVKPVLVRLTTIPKVVQLEHVLDSPDADFHFTINKKGGLRVHIKEIK